MPVQFDRCVKQGGRVRTKSIGKGKYMHVCFLNGKSYPGEVKTKKNVLKKKRQINKINKVIGRMAKLMARR